MHHPFIAPFIARRSPRVSSPLRRLIYATGPVFLAGLTFPDWIRLLHANHWQVDRRFLPRALLVTLASAMTSALKVVDDLTQSDTCDEHLWQRPVFILGLGRSGTTHLFQLIAASQAFAFPSRLDAFYPHGFRTLHRLGIPRFLSLVPGQKRIMDNVTTTWLSPEEDTLALNVLAGRGERFLTTFPETRMLCDQGPDSFAAAMRTFSRRVVQVYKKPPLFKSPRHTNHVKELLAIFPRARFITIFRDPLRIFNSARQMALSGNLDWGALQCRKNPRKNTGLERGKRFTLESYFRNRELIPPSQLLEIRYEELVADQASTLQGVYRFLELPDAPAPVSTEQHRERPLSHVPLDRFDEFLEVYASLYDRGIYERPTRESLNDLK